MGNFNKLDDTRVQAFIDWSQAMAKYLFHRSGTGAPSIVDINHLAWQLLKVSIRGDESHRYDDDYDAAAAEHYMYIRFLASLSGDPACYAAPTIYAAAKILDQVRGKLQRGQVQGGHPVLPANPYIVAWGHSGVIDGLADYKTASGGAPYKLGNAIESLASFKFSPGVASKLGEYAKGTGDVMQGPYAKP
jgi:hypothetical protein